MPREQEQFLEVVDRDTAEGRWLAAIPADVPLPRENVPLAELLARVLTEDVRAGVDVSSPARRGPTASWSSPMTSKATRSERS